MDKLETIEQEVNNVEKKFNQETSLATIVIQKLIRVIIFLLAIILIETMAWIWYISLPVEETVITQEADTEGNSSPINQEIGE